MDDRTRAVQVFDAVADEYDSLGVDFFRPVAAGLVAEVAPRPGEHAADIGCGRGAVLLQLAAAVAPTGSAVGVDLAPRMVDHARAEAARAGADVDVRVGDAMAPDLPRASFDLVTSSLVLFFLPDAAVALRAWRELLVEGGRVGVSTFGPYTPRWREDIDDVLRSYVAADTPDARVRGQAGPFSSDEGMEALLRDAGFDSVRTATTTVSPRFDDPEHWYRWSMSVGQRAMWNAISDALRAEVKARLFDAVDACRDDRGRIGYDQQIRYTLGVR